MDRRRLLTRVALAVLDLALDRSTRRARDTAALAGGFQTQSAARRRSMRKISWISAVVVLAIAHGAATAQSASSVFESPVPPTPAGQVDKLVFAKLSSLGIKPVLCSDAVFIRRAYLDVIGTLPTAQEAREFIESPNKNKRRALIDRLLAREEFADYWAMKWGDLLRIKAEFPVNLWPNAAQAYHRWVRTSIAENKPYDKFVREMLTSSGSNFRVGPVNFYRAVQNKTPEGITAAVALTFMGSRVESWPKERFSGMTAFFSQVGYKPTSEWKEEIVFWDPVRFSAVVANTAPGRANLIVPPKPTDKPAQEAPAAPVQSVPREGALPDGTKIQLPSDRDPREIFADWLISPKNPWFARNIVNRVWSWLLGRGIIHEPDDIRDGNPPSNPALLAYLEREFVASKYDMKHLYRLILNSSTYQFSSMPRFNGPQAEANFASYPLRRLEAEVLIDAVNKITGASDLYTSAIPEPFTYIPRDKPAIALADGSITSAFLTLFGRSARATGTESERTNKPVSAQWLHMLNSSHIQQKLEKGPTLKAIFRPGRKPDEIIEELYLTILSRRPTPEELQSMREYSAPAAPAPPPKTAQPGKPTGPGLPAQPAGPAKPGGPAQPVAPAQPAGPARPVTWKAPADWMDITWALINTNEFLYRH
ncbi:MAG: DUF1553 domain-containing protein [Planctomycetota bacterium]